MTDERSDDHTCMQELKPGSRLGPRGPDSCEACADDERTTSLRVLTLENLLSRCQDHLDGSEGGEELFCEINETLKGE